MLQKRRDANDTKRRYCSNPRRVPDAVAPRMRKECTSLKIAPQPMSSACSPKYPDLYKHFRQVLLHREGLFRSVIGQQQPLLAPDR